MKLFFTVITLFCVYSISGRAEINRVAITSVFVTDFDRAKDWYTQKLGFKPVEDIQFGTDPSDRWVSVSAKNDANFRIVFKLGTPITHQKTHPDQPEAILTVFTDDLLKTAGELKARGVKFAIDPQHDPWAFEAMILDQDGQGIVIAEMKETPR